MGKGQEASSIIINAYIGLGSNLGNRLQILKAALTMLDTEERIAVDKVSPVYETSPLGGPRQGPFLNACALLKTSLPSEELLSKMLNIEDRLGRVREERWGPRLIDLDLLIYKDSVIKTANLELPHPRLAERDFVLIPLFDIAPELLIPGINKTVQALLSDRNPSSEVKLFLSSGWQKQS